MSILSGNTISLAIMVVISHKYDIAKDFEYRNHGLHILTEIKNGTRIVHGYYHSENNNFGWNVPMVGTPQEVISDAIRFCAYQEARYEKLKTAKELIEQWYKDLTQCQYLKTSHL